MNALATKIDKHTLKMFLRKYGMGIIVLIYALFLSVATDTFLTTSNLISVIQQIAVNGCVAMGMVFVICGGGIDLAVGSYIGITSVICGQIFNSGNPSVLSAIALSVGLCTLCGFITGSLVAHFDMFPFVATLAMQLVLRGVAYLISSGYQLPVTYPDFLMIATKRVLGIPVAFIILFSLICFMFYLMHWTKFGRYVYAVGGNINAATASGISVKMVRTLTFALSGFCASLAGLIITARTASAIPGAGQGYEGDAIAACVIGGTSFAGGVATIPGVCIGIIMIGLIYNGMNMLGISSYWQTIVKGLLIIGAVILDICLNKRKS